ncbi:MAG: hypothetical protein M1834_001019 [Cirrosporium novae-zelandiae]|nr:MAG: hypothetical protein M1834_001019 [Cirrosporium novae-zelandiae]
MMNLLLRTFILLSSAGAVFSAPTPKCTTDADCNYNGICTSAYTCTCDPGWRSTDCGALDLYPATRNTGYNQTSNGISSWGGKIIHDPSDPQTFHLFAEEFTYGCGLDSWSPYSRVIRAESNTGPAGPYHFAAEVLGTFAHNPTVVYSPADKLYLMHHIGCPVSPSGTCDSLNFTCGFGNNQNGESGISLMTSTDLRNWTNYGMVLTSGGNGTWDTDVTNPSAMALDSLSHHTPEVLLAYRGCPFNCISGLSELNKEQINLAVAPTFKGPYTRLHNTPLIPQNEDPFLWRDKRGHYHMLMHSLELDGGFGYGPDVGRHAYAETYDGPWVFNNNTLAFNWTVTFTDGTSVDYFRRERPVLFFSEDGEMTPLFLINGVQERNGSDVSFTMIQPLGGSASL